MAVSTFKNSRGLRFSLLAALVAASSSNVFAAVPTNVQAMASGLNGGTASIDVTWEAVTPGDASAPVYIVGTNIANDLTYTPVEASRTQGLSATISGLNQQTIYYVAVRHEVSNVASQSNWSDPIKILTDSDPDGDGILTSEECPDFINAPGACPDTDKDGIPNYMDPDDDDDGISSGLESEDEAGGRLDQDGDTVPDYLEPNNVDTDNNGVMNHLDDDDDGDAALFGLERNTEGEVDGQPLNPPDTDGDGIYDYLDPDSDSTDGANDSDGDGIPDTEECLTAPFCSEDSDEDGLADYLDDTDDSVDDTGAAGIGDDEALITGKDGVGGGSMGLFALIPAFAAGRMRRRKMAAKTLAALAVVLPAAGLMVTPVASAGESQWYLGAGVGQSKVDPDDSKITSVNVSDSRDTGYKLFGGYDFTNHWSVEGFIADLGNAGLDTGDEVSYDMYGLSALYHWPATLPGWAGLAKVGVAHMSNDTDVTNYTQENDTQAFVGLGVEKQFLNGFSLRGEYEYYAEDAALASVNILKRFGTVAAAPEPEVVVVEKEIVAPPESDTDGDGVVDSLDQCPGTPPGTEVDAKGCEFDLDHDGVLNVNDECPDTPAGMPVHANGCPQFTGVLEGVHFETDKAVLTQFSSGILNRVADQMNKYPTLKVIVVGHTDSTGSDAHNQALSLARAKSVAAYLVSKGVRSDRMKYAGYGERFPRASNNTEAGKAQNRRVELLPQK